MKKKAKIQYEITIEVDTDYWDTLTLEDKRKLFAMKSNPEIEVKDGQVVKELYFMAKD